MKYSNSWKFYSSGGIFYNSRNVPRDTGEMPYLIMYNWYKHFVICI